MITPSTISLEEKKKNMLLTVHCRNSVSVPSTILKLKDKMFKSLLCGALGPPLTNM